jgi:hypothetical protein
LQVHHREGVPDFFVCEGLADLDDRYGLWAANVIPGTLFILKPKFNTENITEHNVLENGIQLNTDGVPVFSDRNLSDLTVANVKQLVATYLETIWSKWPFIIY